MRRLFAIPLLALMLSACDAPPASGQPPSAPPAVQFIAVQPQSVAVHETYPARVRGIREVEVRARVDGILEQRLYEEGETVERNEPLFRIEREPFEIALRRAEADRESAAAELRQAERDWARISELYQREVVSESEQDESLSTLELARARLGRAEAEVEAAALDLEYTSVAAPIAGETSLETFPEGTLVERGTLLTRIVQLDPVHVRFSLPEEDAFLYRTALQHADEQASTALREAELILPDGQRYHETGHIDFTASSIESSTSTVTARAVFNNADALLMPGQFVRLRILQRRLDNAFPVPPQAIGQGDGGARVFVVDAEQQVRSRSVTLGPVVDGRQLVLDGLQGGDRLVVDGLTGLRDGMAVNATPATSSGDGS